MAAGSVRGGRWPTAWLVEAEPWRTSRELFERLQTEYAGIYPDGQLRTLQRRVKAWRRDMAQKMVFGSLAPDHASGDAATGLGLWRNGNIGGEAISALSATFLNEANTRPS